MDELSQINNSLFQSGTYALSAGIVLYFLIGILKVAVDPPRWAAPLLAAVGGPLVVLLLAIADGRAMTGQTIAGAILLGLVAGGQAVGVAAVASAEKRGVPLIAPQVVVASGAPTNPVPQPAAIVVTAPPPPVPAPPPVLQRDERGAL